MSEDEKKIIEKLEIIQVCGYKEEIYNYEAGRILNLIEEQEKIIDLMANEIQENLQTCPYDKYYEYIDCENRCKVETEIYKECWKEYFRKKVENEK